MVGSSMEPAWLLAGVRAKSGEGRGSCKGLWAVPTVSADTLDAMKPLEGFESRGDVDKCMQ